MFSAQIYRTKEFIKFKTPNKKYYNDAYYHLGIIIYLLLYKKSWKYLDKKLLTYRYGVINQKSKLDYLIDLKMNSVATLSLSNIIQEKIIHLFSKQFFIQILFLGYF